MSSKDHLSEILHSTAKILQSGASLESVASILRAVAEALPAAEALPSVEALPAAERIPPAEAVASATPSEASTVIANLDALSSPQPKGLRVLPAELRSMIFEKYFENDDPTPSKKILDNPLLQALRHREEVMYAEALAACYSKTPILLSGEWEKNHLLPASQRQWVEAGYAWSLSHETKAQVKNLHIDQWYTSEILCDPFGDKLTPANLTMGKFFNTFTGVTELTLNFKNCKASHLGKKEGSMMIGFHLIFPMIAKFPKLKKLSLLFRNEEYESEPAPPSVRYLGPRRTLVSDWYIYVQHPIVHAFEEAGPLEVITAALGVCPKLGAVRASMLKQENMSFAPRSYVGLYHGRRNSGMGYEVEWFWQAEKGDTLTWNVDKAYVEAEKFGFVMDEKTGKFTFERAR